jgi:hypothetical protein
MSIEIKQESRNKGNSWWAWSVWLKGTKTELDRIEYVTYRLHPTFRVPIRTIRTRKNGFRLDSSGWGGFTIRLDMKYKTGKSVSRSHKLAFEKDNRKPVSSRGRTPVVFVSSSAADTPYATAIINALKSAQVIPRDSSALEPSASLQSSLRKSFQESDAAIAIISDVSSPWQDAELKLAKKLKVPICSILVGKKTPRPEVLRGTPWLRIQNPGDTSKIASKLIASLNLTPKI